jgi:hypothetical protein
MTIQTGSTYALGRSKVEYERLAAQAALIRPMTERLFRESGIGPGHASSTWRAAWEMWPFWQPNSSGPRAW